MESLRQLETNIPFIICKLERIDDNTEYEDVSQSGDDDSEDEEIRRLLYQILVISQSKLTSICVF